MKSCGIYKIQNLQNGKVYIGQSLYIERRIRHHKRALRANDHCNQHAFHVDCSSLVKVCKGKLKSCGKDAAGTPLGWRYLDQAS